jgi:hypothetical protein
MPGTTIISRIAYAIDLAKVIGMKPQRVLLGPVKWAQLKEELDDDMAKSFAAMGMPLTLIMLAQTAPPMGCMIHGVLCEQGNLPGITII